MCYGEFMSSFAACLGKIGHTMRRDSSGTRAGEQRNLIGQMGLIEIAEFCRHSCGAVRRRGFHVLQQGLEPHILARRFGEKPTQLRRRRSRWRALT